MIFKVWLKNEFVWWQPRYNILLSEKRVRNLRFWSTHFFENITLLSISAQTTSSDYMLAGNFTWSYSIILVEDLIGERKALKYFWLTLMWMILKIKILLLRNKSYLHVTHSIIPWFIWYMYYLSTCNRSLFKSYYCYVFFLPFVKLFKFYGKCF